MRKVAIITLHYVDNYGSVLQTLATQLLFENAGCDTSVVNITRENYRYQSQLQDIVENYQKRFPGLMGLVLVSVLKRRWIKNYKCRHAIFEEFRERYIHLTREYASSEDLTNAPPAADIYCTGSDQVWNCTYNGGFLDEYFLSFAPSGKKRIALSASFGKTEYSPVEMEEMKKLLQLYDAISVRERSAVDILSKMGVSGAVHVLDPTLALDDKMWYSHIPVHNIIKRDYVLVYQLNDNDNMIRFAAKISRDKNCELILITRSFKACFVKGRVFSNPTVEQFLSLISFAQYVVTDSFHGTAFSINFNKQFFVFYPPKFSTRLESILDLTNTKHRLIENAKISWKDIKSVDYEYVNRVLDHERYTIKSFVDSAVENE